MKSLFVLSLPRSLSTFTYYVARMMLGLKQPSWASDGEILNIDRMAHYQGRRFDEGAKYTTREHDAVLFQKITDFLSQATITEGFAYKDVVQPFVVAAWPGLSNFCVLRIKRDLTDVAYSMLSMKWYYPQTAVRKRVAAPSLAATYIGRLARFYSFPIASCQGERDASVIKGLVLADATLDRVPSATVDYDDLIRNEGVLRDALVKLYPDANVPEIKYIYKGFCHRRDEILLRRTTVRYKKLQDMVQKACEELKSQ